MIFSHSLLKKFIPKLPSKSQLIDKLNIHVFDAENSSGDNIEVSLPANRYSDASSYWGLAKLISASLNIPFVSPDTKDIKAKINKKAKVLVKDNSFCFRMTARYIEDIKVGPSPKWLQDVLRSHGMKSINNVVDVTNYVMLETGQPTHVFDFDKMEKGTLVVRKARAGERIETLDGQKFKLTPNTRVLADSENALDIAAIKGGTRAELTKSTKNILLTAGSFDGVAVYNTSRNLNLSTDASQRFSHHLSPALAIMGSNRATKLILSLTGGKPGPLVDVSTYKFSKRILKLDVDKINKLIGIKISKTQALTGLKKLGFKVKGNMIEVPELRTDIETHEDLAEEVANIYGYNNISSEAPKISMLSAKSEASAVIKDKAKDILVGFGCSEVYSYSFVSAQDLDSTGGIKWWRAVAIENPVSENFSYLRPSLVIGLKDKIKSNLRFFDSVRVFETGQKFNLLKNGADSVRARSPQGGRSRPQERRTVSNGVEESRALGIAIATKRENPVLELKGIVEQLLLRLGVVRLEMTSPEFDLPYLKKGETLFIKSGKDVIGYLGVIDIGKSGFAAVAEFDLASIEKLAEEEREYTPISKFPSIVRDISILVDDSVRVGDVLVSMQKTAGEFLRDADLIDYFESKDAFEAGKRSLSFRLVFQADNKTLTDKEVNKEFDKISGSLAKDFDAEVR